MPCERHKDALVEAAASGTVVRGELRAHLDQCASCRAALAEEQSLFTVIDSGLQVTANADVPPSLLPRVRSRLDEVAAPRFRWVQPFVLASAGIALAFVVFLLARPHRIEPNEVAQRALGAVPIPKGSAPEKSLETTNSSESSQSAAVRTTHPRRGVRNSTNIH